jgi:hypothetical protein
MELDLTRLNSLAFLDFAGKKEAPKKPSDERKSEGEYKTPIEPKKPLELNTEGLEGIRQLQREADQKKREIDRSLAIYREYQQNIKTSSQLQTELLKGARAGEDIYSLFLKAVKAISLMTSDNLFYNQLEGDIRAIYGIGLQEAPAIDIELQQVTERYIKLLEALEREPDGDSKDRIKQAIKAHENRIRELETLRERESKTS